MRKLIYWVHTSLDGFIDGPNGAFDWPVFAREMQAYAHEVHGGVDTFLYGRKVWDMMSAYWPTADENTDEEHALTFAPIWRSTPKVVFSNTLEKADWDTTVVGGDIAAAVRAMKAEPGRDLLLNGGSQVAVELGAHGLIDDYQVFVHPVMLSGGTPLFPGGFDRLNLNLQGSQVLDGQVVLTRYTKR
ncbi:riboflavin biosynthesis protein RibD [Virgisporangium aliadipatigenens]|uniref:Riboflavin biosynthesis protein RibD n=1 Tax=Virgisporangium aliadipatigenens TaxID=741659 RepID=A0A8J3YS97_9ACTN|nr:dihydrofolate reductase family protein [Virgisporangium aliadipatigenens]GIJ49020.1 riboflavin biosynthesis protein RibD [Virgisporangium aliadipatigenens]